MHICIYTCAYISLVQRTLVMCSALGWDKRRWVEHVAAVVFDCRSFLSFA